MSAAPALLRAAEANAAATNGTRVPNRWLLVVETSRAMQHRVLAIESVIRDLLSSGFGGQLRPGDTLGVWTFNDDLQTGKLPLQRWSPAQAAAITTRISDFIRDQKFERGANTDQAVGPALMLLRDADLLTIVLVTSGEQKIRGTAYDERMAESLDAWLPEQQRRQLPFLTIIRGSKGRITDCAVTPSQWPVEMPSLPPDRVVANANASPSGPGANASSKLPALIIRGKKDTEATRPPPTNDMAAAAEPNKPALAKKEPSREDREPANDQPRPKATELPIVSPAPVLPAPVVRVAEPVPVALSNTAPSPATVQSAGRRPPESNPIAPLQQTNITTAAGQVQQTNVAGQAAMAAASSVAQVQSTREQAKPPAPAREPQNTPITPPQTATVTAPVMPEANFESVTPAAIAIADNPAPPVPAAANGFFQSGRTALLGGIILVLATLFTLILLLRHRKAAPQASLITRSFERREGVSYRQLN